MKPKPGESRDKFVTRCTADGYSEAECEDIYDEEGGAHGRALAYPAVLQTFSRTPWAILPEKLEEMRALLRVKARGGEVSADQIREITAARRADGVQMVGRIALLPVFGVIAQRVGMMGEASGGVGTEALGARLDALMNDREVKSIVMVFDSPGGSVYGVQELGDKIRGYRAAKKIVGVADSVAASAAYWLLSQTAEVNVTPSGQVGSIGVIIAHEDWSAAMEQAGVKVSYITSSAYKAEGAPEFPLSDEARADLQAKVNHYHSAFVGAIAKGRGVTEHKVSTGYGEGRMVTAQDAVDRGMADRVATLETVLRRLGAGEAQAKLAAEGQRLTVAARAAQARARAVEVTENS